MRAGASACTTTRCNRPALGKSFTYDEPSAVEIALLMAAKLTPSALALSRSMSSCNCAASSRPSGRTAASSLLFEAMPSSWLRAASRASWPAPPRSCRRIVKPLARPSSGIGGGLTGKMDASRMRARPPKARPTTLCAEFCGSLRSFQSFSVTKPSAAFCPEPEKLKPRMLTMLATSGCLSMKSSTFVITSLVRLTVAPGGNCTLTIRLPWSSLGRNDEGSRFSSSTTAAMITAYSTMKRPVRLSMPATQPS